MSKPLIRRVTLLAPPESGKKPRPFQAPVYLLENGLALHQSWGPDGMEDLGAPFSLSAVPVGLRLARFWQLEEAEAAFAEVVNACDWSKVGPSGFTRRPKIRKILTAALQKHGAVRG